MASKRAAKSHFTYRSDASGKAAGIAALPDRSVATAMPGTVPSPLTPEGMSLGRQIAKGAVFMVALRCVFRLLGLMSSLILLRILAPSDFGVVGLVTAALAILELMSELSFQSALICMPNPKRIHYDTAWTLGILRSVAVAALLAASAPALADFVDDPRILALGYALAGIALLQGFENVGLVDFQRSLAFERFFRFQVFGKLAGVCVTVPLAFWLHNYWALMAGIAATRLSMTALSFVISDYRPRLSLAAWHDLFNFSKWLLVSNLESVIDSYAMIFVTGHVAGPAAIGLYQVANHVASLPASEVAAPIRQPMYAGMSRAAHDIAQLRRHVIDGLGLSVAVVTPMSVGIALMARPIVELFFGPQWTGAVTLVQLCALYALFDSVGHFTHNLYIVMQRQRRFVGTYAAALAVRIPALILGAAVAGVNGAACALMLTAIFNMVLWTCGIFPLAGIPYREAFFGTWRTVFGALVMTVAVLWLSALWQGPQDYSLALLRFAVISLIGAAVHVGSQLAAWRISGSPAGAEQALIKTAFQALERLGVWPRARSAQPSPVRS
jgi:O-antigen/teichoic acid export membrane protein